MSRSDDMSALREQVQAGHLDRQAGHLDRRAGRGGRLEFVTALTQSGIELNKANQAENKERRRSLIATLTAYMKRLHAHEKNRMQEASRMHKARAQFVTNLARTIGAQRKANAAENAAARSSLFGAGLTAESPKQGAGWLS